MLPVLPVPWISGRLSLVTPFSGMLPVMGATSSITVVMLTTTLLVSTMTSRLLP